MNVNFEIWTKNIIFVILNTLDFKNLFKLGL